jgi:ParB family transcriptional regulator, chromosome partitioning protein
MNEYPKKEKQEVPVIDQVKIANIKIGHGRRELKEEVVLGIMESVGETGLLNPITVSKDFLLIAGLHRLEACKRLGREEITAKILDVTGLDMELAMLDENLCRADLSVLERGEQLIRRKEIYEQRYPETRHGGSRKRKSSETDQAAEEKQRFTKTMAVATGHSETKIQRSVRIVKKIPPPVRNIIRGTSIANSLKDLTELSKRSEDEQTQLAAAIQANPELTVQEALASLGGGGEKREKTQKTNDPPKAAENLEETAKGKKQIGQPKEEAGNTTESPQPSPKPADDQWDDEGEDDIAKDDEPPSSEGNVTPTGNEKESGGTTEATPTPTKSAGTGDTKETSAAEQPPPKLSQHIENIFAQASQDPQRHFIVFVEADQEQPIDFPDNVHFARFIESSLESNESEGGNVFATFKVEFQPGSKDLEVFRAGRGVINKGLIEYQTEAGRPGE